MLESPDPRDPVAYLPWRCEMSARVGDILVVVVHDGVRSLLLRNTARRLGVPYLVCEPKCSPRSFLEFLGRGLGLGEFRGRHALWDALRARLRQPPRLVMLDQAEHLTPRCLSILLDFHKAQEHVHREVSFVLASGQRRLLQRIENVDSEGSFMSHCSYYTPACELTRKLRQVMEQLDFLLRAPTIPFPSRDDDQG